MADNVIGDAVIEVGADGAKFNDDLKGLSKNAPGIGERIAGLMGKTLKIGVAAVGVAAGGVLAKTLFGGFNRLANIDQATKKLEGLGHTGKALQTIMDNALKSVEGTAFGLDEAATVAANLTAAGLKAGDELTDGLTLAANLASVAGVSMQEMGDVLTEVAANGKVTGDTLARLQVRGIPATQLLADSLGKSREEVQKLVKSGKVDFATFAEAMDETMGDAARIAGESFRGMLANIGAAMNRLGAVILGPVFEGVKSIMPNIIEFFNRLAAAIQPIVDKWGPKIAEFFEWLGEVIDRIDFSGFNFKIGSLAEVFTTVSDTVYGVMFDLINQLPVLMVKWIPLAAEYILNKADTIIDLIRVIIEAMADALETTLPALIVTFSNLLPQMIAKVVEFIPSLVGSFTQLIQAAIDLLPTLLPAVVDGIVALITAMVEVLPTLIPVLLDAAYLLFLNLVTGLLNVLPVLLESLLSMLPTLIQTILGMVPQILRAGLDLFLQLVEAVVTVLPVLLDTIIDMLPEILDSIISMLPDIIDAALEVFFGIVQAVIDTLPVLLETLLDMLPEILEVVLGMLPELLDAAIQLFYGLIMGVIEILPELLVMLLSMAPQIAMTILSMVPDLLGAAVELFYTIVQAVFDNVPKLLQAVWDLGPRIASAIGSLWGQIYQAGKDLIEGLIQGVKDMAGRVWEGAKELGSNILNGVRNFFGINSPSKVFKEIGVNLVQGLVKGLDDSRKDASRAVDRLLKEIDKGEGLVGKNSLLRYVKEQGKALDTAWWRIDKGVEKIENARDKLKDLNSSFDSMRASIADNVFGELDLSATVRTNKITGESFTSITSIASTVSKMRAKAERYGTLMQSLVNLGFPPGFTQMIAGYGLDAAIAIAEALIQGTPDERSSIIENFAGFQSAADLAGKTLATQMYGAGISAQQGLLAGLNAKQDDLVAAAEKIATTLTSTIKKKLGIASPSKVYFAFGESLGTGLALGLDKMRTKVGLSLDNMIQPVTSVPTSTPGRSDAQVVADTLTRNMAPLVASGPSQTHISVQVDMSDLEQIKTFEDFLKMLQVRARMGQEGEE